MHSLLKRGLRRLAAARRHGEQAGREERDPVPAVSPGGILALALVISCIAHLAFLAPALVFGGRPFDAPPADAVAVDLVSAAEVAQLAEGWASAETPERTTAGEAPIKAPDASGAPPPAVPGSPAPQHMVTPAQAVSPPAARPRSATLPQPQSEPQQAAPAEASTAGTFAMPLTMPDGSVGDRTFDQRAVDQADVNKDVAAAFFAHLKTCSTPPADAPSGVRVVLRVYLNPDGTLAAGLPANPEPLKVSMGGGELFVNAVAALRQCQPYTMLPRDRYPEWRMLDLTFTPQNF